MTVAPDRRRARVRASLIHAASSLAVAGAAAALVFLLWYPAPYRTVSGGVELFLMVTGIDVIVGPLLTLLVFDLAKPRGELMRDLAVVVVLQLAALGYGLYTVAQARPVVLALEGERFRAVIAASVVLDELPQALPEFRSLGFTGPRVVNTEAPTGGTAQLDAISKAFEGVDLGMRPSFWRPWNEDARRTALERAKPWGKLAARYPERAAEAAEVVARTGRSADQLRYLPLLARRTDWVVLLDGASGEIVGFAPFDSF